MKKEKNASKINKKIIVILTISIVIIALVITGIIFVKKISSSEDYYSEKLRILGFDVLFDEDEKITKLEAMKIAIAIYVNKTDIKDYAYVSNSPDDERWVEFAHYAYPLIESVITKENMYEEATISDLAMFLEYVKSYTVGEKFNTQSEVKLENYSYISSVFEEHALIKLVEDGIIENDGRFKEIISMAELNKIVVKFIYKNKVVLSDRSNELNIEKKNDKLYPYTLSNIDKEIYKMPLKYKNEKGYKSPKDSYAELKRSYRLLTNTVNDGLSYFLNIDYNNIDEEEFSNKVFSLYYSDAYDEEKINNYIKFVKDNNIKIEGKAQIIEPVIYKDDKYVYARVKLTYKITNSNNLDNVIFGDINKKYELNKEYENVYDIAFENSNYFFYVINTDLNTFKVK